MQMGDWNSNFTNGFLQPVYHNYTSKNQIKIYILSSSIDERDKQRANQNAHVMGYIEKPLSRELIFSCSKKEAASDELAVI